MDHKCPKDETVTIPKTEYDRLCERDHWLCCLDAAGIDSCEAYLYAQEIKDEWKAEGI
jgi:hypothetical protein